MSASAELIRLIRVQARLYHNAKVCGDWMLREHALGQTCFHIVTAGECRVQVPQQLDTVLRAGDLIVFPREIAHVLLPASPQIGEQRHLPFQADALEEGTGLLCAEVQFRHRASDEILNAIPPFLIIRNDAASPWLAPLLALILAQSLGPSVAADEVLDRLCDLLFIYALSHFFEASPQLLRGPLAAHAHPRLRLALDAIHRAPARAWSLEQMAREAAMSRTLFARVFKQLSGWTPMQYLSWWRMQLAWDRLDEGESVSSVAEALGYGSHAAFSRVFKKCFGVNPGRMRRR